MCKNSILGLILVYYISTNNSTMNKSDVQEGYANGLYRVCTHSSNTDDENMDILQLIMSLVSVYETGFVLRSLMA